MYRPTTTVCTKHSSRRKLKTKLLRKRMWEGPGRRLEVNGLFLYGEHTPQK